ncbi:MAG: NUDIX hydrolase [Mariniphaga sp.]|nr:NUDIX hydrolase [Mariniphaga sp.]MDD4226232.1 NUDIX hydrolase [Mariniphaga sp.]
MKEKQGQFILRVYGIILNEYHEVLITDEFQVDRKMTKFPGGGLEYGEGTIDCLRREFREECNGQEIENIRHFYTTDFFQQASFFENHQLISIYYLATLKYPVKFTISEQPFDFKEMKNGNQSFRWVQLKNLKIDELSFPIDKFAVKQLLTTIR